MEPINDGINEFNVEFHGPKESKFPCFCIGLVPLDVTYFLHLPCISVLVKSFTFSIPFHSPLLFFSFVFFLINLNDKREDVLVNFVAEVFLAIVTLSGVFSLASLSPQDMTIPNSL